MFLRFWCFALLVCAFSQVYCEDDEKKLDAGDLIKILSEGLLKNKTASASTSAVASAVACATSSAGCTSTTTTTSTSTTTEAPKGSGPLKNFAGSIVNNTKKAVHVSSNVVLGGVKNVGNIIKGGWNFADNVVDGSFDLAKKIGSLGYKIVTVLPKSLNDVLLDIAEKGQKKLKEKLKKEENKKDKDSTTKAPETTDGDLFIYLNNVKIPVTVQEVVEIANVLKGNKDSVSSFPLLTDAPEQPYFVVIDNDEAHVLNSDQLIEIADLMEEEKKKIEEKNKITP